MEKIFYLAQVFEGLNALAIILMILSVLTLIAGFVAFVSEEMDRERMKMITKVTMPIIIVSIILVIFLPTRHTFLLMMGGKAVDSIVEDKPEVKELPGNTLDLLNEYIKAETEKIRNKDKE